MKRRSNWLWIIAAIMLGGCAFSQEETALKRDLDEMKSRLAYLEQRAASESQASQGQANMQADLDNLRVELQTVRGQLADQERQNAQLKEELTTQINNTKKTVERAPAPAPAKTVTKEEQPESTDAEDVYKQALARIRENGDYSGGRKALQGFVKTYPDNSLVPNALYWIGETYYAEKDYENAIVQFQKVLDKYPQHAKAAASLLKQALSFQTMGDSNSALVLYDKVVASYPTTSEAGVARQKASALRNK
ncbi:MAG: tol-pal system protein YbgF [Deltaproteobacteria bacterium]|nr:tol-pal system protein YbgF [Deltaproteobacteria bacterium]MBR5998466.1 tol-pal system protein YbgF [Deltaproteobacteria bacterium]